MCTRPSRPTGFPAWGPTSARSRRSSARSWAPQQRHSRPGRRRCTSHFGCSASAPATKSSARASPSLPPRTLFSTSRRPRCSSTASAPVLEHGPQRARGRSCAPRRTRRKPAQGDRARAPLRPERRPRRHPASSAERYGVPVLEDAAEALGTLHQRPAGRRARRPSASFSFNGNKIITTTGGGAHHQPRPRDRVTKRPLLVDPGTGSRDRV